MRGVVTHVTTVVKCSKQNMENVITNLNTPDSTGSDAKNVEKVLTQRHFTRNIIACS